MQNIREELQTWLELVTRGVKNIPFDKEVDWFDIEDVYNGSHSESETPMYKAYDTELSFETVYGDAVDIDHMCSEILPEDFPKTIHLLKRYKGVIITEHLKLPNK